MTDEETLIAGAKTFPDRMLADQFIETLDRALEINNSGLFKVAAILMDELDHRGYGSEKFRQYRDLLKLAVSKAEARDG